MRSSNSKREEASAIHENEEHMRSKRQHISDGYNIAIIVSSLAAATLVTNYLPTLALTPVTSLSGGELHSVRNYFP